jgi:hypothetical protein
MGVCDKEDLSMKTLGSVQATWLYNQEDCILHVFISSERACNFRETYHLHLQGQTVSQAGGKLKKCALNFQLFLQNIGKLSTK